jgi:hypothetical protein
MPRSIGGRWCCLRRGSWRHSKRLRGLKVDLPATTRARRATGDTEPQNVRRSQILGRRSAVMATPTCSAARVCSSISKINRYASIRPLALGLNIHPGLLHVLIICNSTNRRGAVSMENLRLREAAPTPVNVTVGQRSREYLTDREVERLIEAAKQNRSGHRDATATTVE